MRALLLYRFAFFTLICIQLFCICSCDYKQQQEVGRGEDEVFYVLLAVSGTLEEGFELRPNLDYRPYHGDDGNNDNNHKRRVNATFLGTALVRGYKSFLDIKNPTWREYKKGDDFLKTVNPAVIPTGCEEHGNRYAIYAVDSRQALHALAGEPRFLSIAPDMGLADLKADDAFTSPDIKALAVEYANNATLSGIHGSPSNDRIAFLTVTSTWFKSTFVPNGILYQDEFNSITDYPESTGIWSKNILNQNNKTHNLYPEGCGSDPTGGKVQGVHTAMDYNLCIDAAIRLQEAEYTLNGNGDQVGDYEGYENCIDGRGECFACRSKARYGTDKTMARFNKVLSACELETLMVQAGVTSSDGGPKYPLQGCSLVLPPLPSTPIPAPWGETETAVWNTIQKSIFSLKVFLALTAGYVIGVLL